MCKASFLVAYQTREGFSTNLHERDSLVGGGSTGWATSRWYPLVPLPPMLGTTWH